MFSKMNYIYTIYKEQSFTKAAEKLYVSQPALSAAVKKTEELVGMPLFERHPGGICLTQIGLEYIRTAEKIRNIENEFVGKVGGMGRLEHGSLTVGGSNFVSSYIIPPIVGEFSRLYPGIDISIAETNSLELEKKLCGGEIDLVIDNFEDISHSVECVPLLEEKILLAVPTCFECNRGLEEKRIKPHELYGKNFDYGTIQKVSITHFKDENFILLKNGNSMQRHAAEIFRKGGILPNVSFRLDQLITSYALAATGNGVCFVSDTLFKFHAANDDVFLYDIDGSTGRTLYIAGKHGRHKTRAMERFEDIAAQVIAKKFK